MLKAEIHHEINEVYGENMSTGMVWKLVRTFKDVHDLEQSG